MTDNYFKYSQFVDQFIQLHQLARSLPIGSSRVGVYGRLEPSVMLFSPHPDDECVIGALPLRLKQELDQKVINVAVTLGSDPDRKIARLQEVKKACETLGFSLLLPCEQGFDAVNLEAKKNNPDAWFAQASIIADILIEYWPNILIFPHNKDYNSTHIGVHQLLVDALALVAKINPSWQPWVVETEFWHMLEFPNLFLGVKPEDEALLLYALSAHRGELERNPYHIYHPARMMDNVMRGSEVVRAQGTTEIVADFAMLYRCHRYIKGCFKTTWQGGRCVLAESNLAELFAMSGCFGS